MLAFPPGTRGPREAGPEARSSPLPRSRDVNFPSGNQRIFSQTFTTPAANVSWTLGLDASSAVVSRDASNDAYGSQLPFVNQTYTPNGLNQYTGTGFSYDNRGNLISGAGRSFTYDLENRLLTASAPTAVALTYDPVGRLQTSTAGGAGTTFLYDGTNLSAEYDDAGNVLRRYVSLPGVDQPLIWYEGADTSNRRLLQRDQQGSVMAYSTASGALGAAYSYGPYGEPDAANGWGGSRYRYTGQITLPEAQLYYYKARVYDPVLGRFLQTDPAGYASDLNPYAYAANDPINGSDPFGLGDDLPPAKQQTDGGPGPGPDVVVTGKATDWGSWTPVDGPDWTRFSSGLR